MTRPPLTLLKKVDVPVCGICSKACREVFRLRRGNGLPVDVGDCCALQVAADIYRVAVTFAETLPVKADALNEASNVMAVFAGRHKSGFYMVNESFTGNA